MRAGRAGNASRSESAATSRPDMLTTCTPRSSGVSNVPDASSDNARAGLPSTSTLSMIQR
jgi:hypothetical protein